MPENISLDKTVEEIRSRMELLRQSGRTDLMLKAVGASTLDELCMEAARTRLSRLVITSNYRFLLPDYNKEIDLSPIHKAVYMLFLNHPEGIEFKNLADYRQELCELYKKTAKIIDIDKIEESVARLTDPLDNAINEKCSRIKKAFSDVMDSYAAAYYVISGHGAQTVSSTGRVWYKRLKVVRLPRQLVVYMN